MDYTLKTPVNSRKIEAIQQVSSKHFLSMLQIEKISILLDSKYVIPRTKIRFGLDPVIGILPVIGDIFSLITSCVLIFAMYKHGPNKEVAIKMLYNAVLDAVIGSIPGIGLLFNIYFKANQRNLVIFEDYFFKRHKKSFDDPFDKTGLIFCLGVFMIIIYMMMYFYFDIGSFN